MITGPDGSLRRESMQSGQTEAKQPVFYTQNEVRIFYPSGFFNFFHKIISYSLEVPGQRVPSHRPHSGGLHGTGGLQSRTGGH